jgi:hypothetical protein
MQMGWCSVLSWAATLSLAFKAPENRWLDGNSIRNSIYDYPLQDEYAYLRIQR